MLKISSMGESGDLEGEELERAVEAVEVVVVVVEVPARLVKTPAPEREAWSLLFLLLPFLVGVVLEEEEEEEEEEEADLLGDAAGRRLLDCMFSGSNNAIIVVPSGRGRGDSTAGGGFGMC